MRRKTHERLAHLTRAAFLLAVLGAGATAAIWQWWPGLLQRVELGLRKTLHGPYHVATEWARALERSDPARARAILSDLVDELRYVRKGDQLAALVGSALRQLSRQAEAVGDLEVAVARVRQQLDLDDQDFPARLRLSELLCARESTRPEGLQRLRDLRQLLPSYDAVSALLVRKLVEAGRSNEALAVLRDAQRVMRPGLWLVRWKSPEGDRGRSAGLVLKESRDGETELRFAIAGPLLGFTILPPRRAGLRLSDARVFHTTAGGEIAFPLDSGFVTLQQMRPARGCYETLCPGDPGITVTLPQPLPAGTWEFGLRARVAPGISQHLEKLPFAPELTGPVPATLPPELAATLAAIRTQALAKSRIQVFWRGPGERFRGVGSRFAHLNAEAEGNRVPFTIELPLDVEAERLRVDFPDFPGAEYRFSLIEVHRESGIDVLEPSDMEVLHLHSLRRDGAAFIVTGDDPYFTFPVPGGHRRVAGLRAEGVVR